MTPRSPFGDGIAFLRPDRVCLYDQGMINCHTMAKAKVAVTIDTRILEDLDALIAADRFPNRSQAVEAALADKIDRLRHTRLAREAAKLDPHQEQAEADENLATDAATWPEY